MGFPRINFVAYKPRFLSHSNSYFKLWQKVFTLVLAKNIYCKNNITSELIGLNFPTDNILADLPNCGKGKKTKLIMALGSHISNNKYKYITIQFSQEQAIT